MHIRTRWSLLVPVTVALGLVAAVSGAAELRLSEGGQTAYVIVTGANPIPAEQTAARELAEYLQKVTGAEFKTVAETAAEKPPKAIYLGWTAFAAAKGIDCAALGREEWVIKSFGDDLVIAGGRPRGTLYGVYDFLEKELGVYWLDRDTEVVPKRPTLALAAIDRRAMPIFRMRCVYTAFHEGGWGWEGATGEKERRFRTRSRQNQFGYGGSEMRPYGGGEYAGHIYRGCHNFGFYVPGEKYFAEHPEYFALDKDGKRLATSEKDGQAGGLCLTHPEVRRIALARLLELIAADRKEFPPGTPASPDQPPPSLYDVSQPDNAVVCHCPSCRSLVEREGSESGPLIDFINALADGVRERYPEIKVQTFAYTWSQVPPKTLRPRDNVVIRWCNWYMPGMRPEPWLPLTAPVNAWRAENLRQWAAITPGGINVWDYGEPYGVPSWPFTLAPVVAGNLRFLADSRPVGLILETEEWGAPIEGPWRNGHFSPLYNWLAMLLMVEPRRPIEPLIGTFMAGYYGPAAAPMRAFYDKLATAQRDLPPRSLAGGNMRIIKHVTPAFFAEAETLLEQAERACAADSLELAHVQRERWRLDVALLDCWDALRQGLAPGAAMPFEREAVLARLETRSRPLWLRLGYPAKHVDGFLSWKLPLLRSPVVELPERFRHLPQDRVVQYYWRDFVEYQSALVPDPDAAGGRGLRRANAQADDHQADPAFGLYDFNRKENGPSLKIAKADVPQDGKYHWYKVGRWRILPGVSLWGHWSWTVGCPDLAKKAYVPDETPGANDWEVWVSAKFTGPAYIKDSQEKENGYYLDRVVLVRQEAAAGK